MDSISTQNLRSAKNGKSYLRVRRFSMLLVFAMGILTTWSNKISAQVPELMYFTFDAGTSTITNYAASTTSTGSATLVGSNYIFSSSGQFSKGLQGNGGNSSTDYVNTGWAPNIGSGSWTVSLWIDKFNQNTTTSYFFGDANTSSFRCFTGGVAGQNGLRLTGGGLTTVDVASVGPGPAVIHYVYDAPNKVVRVYVNGSLSTSVTQTGTPSFSGTGPFKVAGYGTGNNIHSGTVIDEFRLYSRALSGTEISNTWNKSLLTSTTVLDDAGVSSLVAPVAFCSGTQDIKVQIKNFGNNQVNGVTVNWSLNGTTQTAINYSNILDTSGGSGFTTAVVTLGSHSFSSTGSVNLKVWTSAPNNKTDGRNTNDTLVAVLKPSLSGTYTIGGTGADYSTLTAAIADLGNYGVCGPTVFNIAAGSYSGRVVLKAISGASATNTISFIGAGSSSTIITNAGTGTTDWQTVLLDGADYITFKDLSINGTGATYGVGVMFTNSANYNRIENCVINLSTTSTSTNFFGIAGSGSATSGTTYGDAGNYNVIKDNTINGGYYGIRFNGTSTSSYVWGNQFINNDVLDFYYYGVYLYYIGGADVKGNTIHHTRNTGTTYGLYCYYITDYDVSENIVNSSYYSFNIYYGNYYLYNTSFGRARVANNMVTGTNASGYGFRIAYNYYADVYHNSVLAAGTYVGYIYDNRYTNVKNNIFMGTKSGTMYTLYAYYNDFTGGYNIDHNIFYAPNATSAFYHEGTTYANLALMQAAFPKENQNSLQQDPGFVSATDLHMSSFGAKPFGPNLGLERDVDGDARCEFAPTIGADESIIGKGIIKVQAGIFPPSTIYTNTPAVFEGKQVQGALQKNHWYLDGVFMKDTIDFVYTFTSAGTHTLKVITIGCGSTDTAEKNITVITQSKAPVADFAMETTVAQGDVLRFMDLSENGPETWKWEITPDIYYDVNNQQQPRYKFVSGDATSFNPAVRFDQTGRYRVCLTVTNAFGSDVECRTNYITVVPRVNLGSGTVTTESTGYLYDDGGVDGNYSNGQLKGMLIKPCASEVYMVFNNFKLDCQDDYVRIYDGADNKAPALHPCKTNIGNGGGPGLTGPGCALACVPSLNDTFIASSGMMYIEFYSSANNNAPGFEAHWWSTPANVPAPVADIEAPDSICVGSIVTFYNKSQGKHVKVQWELDGDDKVFESEDTVSAEWAFVIPGTASVKLIAENCGGTDTMVKTFIVYQPTALAIGFVSDNLNPATTDDVTFISTIKGCVDKYKWTITKVYGSGTFTQLDGTTLTSAVTKVMFHDTGLWTIELWAENVTGNNTLVKTGYIKVKEAYCTPTVGTVISDIGISKAVFNTITNTTSQGVSAYTNYVSTKKTNVEIGATYELELTRNSNVNNISWAAWIDWNQDGDFNDLQEKAGSETNSNGKTWKIAITIPVHAKEGPTVMRVGVSRGTGANTPCGQNNYGEFEDYRLVVTLDRTLPVITLTGSADMVIEQGRKYIEPGFTAEDNLDGTITPDVKADTFIVATNQLTTTLNTYVVRDYEIRYRVKDAAGNTGIAVRTVRVIPDTTAPQLTISNGVNLSVDIAAGTYNTPAVIKAEDNIDGVFTTQVMKVSAIDPQLKNVVQIIDLVDPTKVGVYTVTYFAIDMLGNAATVTRTVRIYDDVLPVMSLIGANPVKHQIGEPYNDLGVTISDNYYEESELETKVIISENVNENKFGTYSYSYNLTDPSGNGPVTIIRQVIVTDTIVPEISLIGTANVVTEVNRLFIDQGVKVADNYGIKGNWTAGGSFYAAFPDAVPTALGTYVITYSVEDLAGNIVTVDRTVEVKDRTAPVISLIGNSAVNICRWKDYNDSGYTVSDNFNSDTELTIKKEGTWLTEGKPTGLNGTYSLRYIVEDQSGNVAYSQMRTINVLHETDYRCKGTYTGIEDNKILEKHVSIYPNPTNGRLTVKLNLEEMKQVRLSVVNMMGQEIAAVAEGQLQEGVWTVDLSAQSAGVYFLRVTAEGQIITKRVVLTK